MSRTASQTGRAGLEHPPRALPAQGQDYLLGLALSQLTLLAGIREVVEGCVRFEAVDG